jgi:hypothetical protein
LYACTSGETQTARRQKESEEQLQNLLAMQDYTGAAALDANMKERSSASVAATEAVARRQQEFAAGASAAITLAKALVIKKGCQHGKASHRGSLLRTI